MKILFLLATLSFSYLSQARPDDVYGTSNYYVKVTENDSREMVRFELCHLRNLKPCEQIGSRKFYDKDKLIELRGSEKWDVLSSLIADVVVIAGLGLGGGALACSLTTSGTAAATIYGTIAGVAGGSSIGTIATVVVDALNPAEQYAQLETLEKNVLNDKEINLDYDAQVFAKRLAAVLDNL